MLKYAVILVFPCICFTSYGQTASPKLADLNWLAGCWSMNNPESAVSITEMWMKPDGGMMMGVGRMVKQGRPIGFEFLRIVQDDAGAVNDISRPQENKEETTFKLIKWSAREVTFENAAHDFPQRIIYRSAEKDKLSARIQGTQNGKSRGIDFAYTRAACE